MKRQTIAVDIDDVLSRSAEGFIAFTNETWNMQLTPKDFSEEWTVVWGVSIEEAVARTVVFYASGTIGSYVPYEAAMPVLGHLKERFRLVALTSRKAIAKPETERWVERHFPGIFEELHYAGIWDDATAADAHKRIHHTKAEMCREIGADYLIDDQPKHCVGAAQAGIQTLLFGDYSWNRQPRELPPGVARVAHWQDVLEYFDAQG